tara:strand:- start:174 stop:1439 length:1266 start_codon:yes stop_codon:yes gene_type:complete
LNLEFEDADTATEFVEDITALEVIPMVLEENDISPYGDELEVAGGAPIPAVYEYSFIGNGIDSSLTAPPLASVPSFIGMHIIYKCTSILTGDHPFQQFGPGVTGSDRFAILFRRSGNLIGFYTNNAVDSSAWTTTSVFTPGNEYSIQIGYTMGGTPLLYVNGVNVTMTAYYGPFAPVTPITALPILNTIGKGLSSEVLSEEIYDSYWSTNTDFILTSSVASYAEDPNPQEDNRPFYTGKELFSQAAPDVLIGDWKGGATQGQTEISPEVPGTDGPLNFYLERAPTFKVDGYNNVTVELRTLLSKDNITYPTTHNSTILDTLPYDWKYRENIYTQFNNNTTLAGINYNTQNSPTGRSLRLQFRLLKTEYLELRKFIFNKRYTPFAYNSLVGGFPVNTMMAIGDYSMSFTGKLYNITLILEEQ